MEISNLLGKIRGGEKDKPKPFLAIELTDEVVQAAVWYVEAGKTNLSTIGTPMQWDGDKGETAELVTASDATVSSAIEGSDVEPAEVIFGVAANWAGESGILPDKLKLIKLICQELELKPLGFVVVSDSLLRYLKMQEGTPATSIMVQVARDTVTVSLVELGKLTATEIIGRSDDISADVEEGISRFASDQELPSRILVYNSTHSLEEEVQNLISYDWKSKFNFLHIPKIESLPKDVLIRSIAVAGGSEVAKAIGFEIADPPAQAPAKEEPDTKPEMDTELLSAADFGFVPDKKSVPEPAPARLTLTPDAPAKPSQAAPAFKLSMPSFSLPKLKLRLPRPAAGKPFVILGFVVLLLFALFVTATWLVPQAVVSVYVEPKNLEENVELTLSTSATSIDQASSTVPAAAIEKVIAGEESVTTTGKKTVGDPARGEVTIFNRTTITKTFSKGTVLTAKSLKFTLDESVTVASKSAGADYVDVPGKGSVKVTANAIGGDSNLASGTEFVVENFAKDTYVAKNDQALSGGSSKEIQVVSQADQDSVGRELLAKLKEEGKQVFLSELGAGKGVYVMDQGTEIIKESYSAEVGQEATALIASYEVKLKGVSYQTSDVENLISQKLTSAIPPGYERTSKLPVVELGEVDSESEDGVEIQAKIIVELLPMVNRETIQQALRGLAAASIESKLSDVVGLKGAEVEITPAWLPPRFKRMPRNPANISVEIVPAPL